MVAVASLLDLCVARLAASVAALDLRADWWPLLPAHAIMRVAGMCTADQLWQLERAAALPAKAMDDLWANRYTRDFGGGGASATAEGGEARSGGGLNSRGEASAAAVSWRTRYQEELRRQEAKKQAVAVRLHKLYSESAAQKQKRAAVVLDRPPPERPPARGRHAGGGSGAASSIKQRLAKRLKM